MAALLLLKWYVVMLWPVTTDWTRVRKWNYWFCPDQLKSNFLDWMAGICPFPWPLGDPHTHVSLRSMA